MMYSLSLVIPFNLWYKDMGTHYEYIGTYVDDLLIASMNPKKIIDALKEVYVLKGVGIPEYYLGADILEAPVEWKAEPVDWIITAKSYTKNVIAKFEELMAEGKTNMSLLNSRPQWIRTIILSWTSLLFWMQSIILGLDL